MSRVDDEIKTVFSRMSRVNDSYRCVLPVGFDKAITRQICKRIFKNLLHHFDRAFPLYGHQCSISRYVRNVEVTCKREPRDTFKNCFVRFSIGVDQKRSTICPDDTNSADQPSLHGGKRRRHPAVLGERLYIVRDESVEKHRRFRAADSNPSTGGGEFDQPRSTVTNYYIIFIHDLR